MVVKSALRIGRVIFGSIQYFTVAELAVVRHIFTRTANLIVPVDNSRLFEVSTVSS